MRIVSHLATPCCLIAADRRPWSLPPIPPATGWRLSLPVKDRPGLLRFNYFCPSSATAHSRLVANLRKIEVCAAEDSAQTSGLDQARIIAISHGPAMLYRYQLRPHMLGQQTTVRRARICEDTLSAVRLAVRQGAVSVTAIAKQAAPSERSRPGSCTAVMRAYRASHGDAPSDHCCSA